MKKLKPLSAFLLLCFAFPTLGKAESLEASQDSSNSVFHFSTQVTRSVKKDLMQATIYSRKSGKNLAELRKEVSSRLNKVLEQLKQQKTIEFSADGVSNSAEYDKNGKITGWTAEGQILLESRDFEAVAKVLENLGEHLAIQQISFSVSPEKMRALEDEMTLEIIEQFQHKAAIIQKGLKAEKYLLSDIRLSTPNGNSYPTVRMYKAAPAMMGVEADAMPIEAGEQTISAEASGKVTFK